MMPRKGLPWVALAALVSREVSAFVPPAGLPSACYQPSALSVSLSSREEEDAVSSSMIRRTFMHSVAASLGIMFLVPTTTAADTGAQVRGTPVTPFNSLIFQYRGKDFGGLTASELNEPSVTYAEFVERLKAGEVEFVEFIAPNGDAAYVTFKGKQPSIRIGEGYPLEQNDGWSSPSFAIRTVKNAGVPYKFTVPALRDSKN